MSLQSKGGRERGERWKGGKCAVTAKQSTQVASLNKDYGNIVIFLMSTSTENQSYTGYRKD